MINKTKFDPIDLLLMKPGEFAPRCASKFLQKVLSILGSSITPPQKSLQERQLSQTATDPSGKMDTIAGPPFPPSKKTSDPETVAQELQDPLTFPRAAASDLENPIHPIFRDEPKKLPLYRTPEISSRSYETVTFLSPVPSLSCPSIIQNEHSWLEQWVVDSPENEKKARHRVMQKILDCLKNKSSFLDLGGLPISSIPDLGKLAHVTDLDLSCTFIQSLSGSVLPPNLNRINLIATSISSPEDIPSTVNIIPNETLLIKYPDKFFKI